jgi:hypothetical protein
MRLPLGAMLSSMSMSFWPSSATGYGTATAAPSSGQDGSPQPATVTVDLRAARRAGRSCCCPARPALIAVMPPASGRPHQSDLLLCGHHYRLSRRALAIAGAMVMDMAGSTVTGSTWSPHAGSELA